MVSRWPRISYTWCAHPPVAWDFSCVDGYPRARKTIPPFALCFVHAAPAPVLWDPSPRQAWRRAYSCVYSIRVPVDGASFWLTAANLCLRAPHNYLPCFVPSSSSLIDVLCLPSASSIASSWIPCMPRPRPAACEVTAATDIRCHASLIPVGETSKGSLA